MATEYVLEFAISPSPLKVVVEGGMPDIATANCTHCLGAAGKGLADARDPGTQEFSHTVPIWQAT